MDHIAYDPQPLKLGKGVAFVKSQLIRLPQDEEEIWEADFMPWRVGPTEPVRGWMGLVVHQEDWLVAETQMEQPPSINDMATLLANAMCRPYGEHRCRPRTIRLRKRREWELLHPHLAQLGIEVSAAPRLAHWDKAFKQCCREAAESKAKLRAAGLEAKYPYVAAFVKQLGCIEIGHQEEVGFVVRAVDNGGLVFETQKPKTFHAAMAALERGIGKWLGKHG
jgi:hypothetical protein